MEQQAKTQTFEINVTSLPAGGLTIGLLDVKRIGLTNTAALTVGVNTITVSSVSFDRTVKIQFSSGDIAFNSIVIMETILI